MENDNTKVQIEHDEFMNHIMENNESSLDCLLDANFGTYIGLTVDHGFACSLFTFFCATPNRFF